MFAFLLGLCCASLRQAGGSSIEKKKHLATKKQPLCFEHPDFSNQIHLRNLTYIPKMATFKRSHHFQTIIVGLHVSFQGCVCSLSFFWGGGRQIPDGNLKQNLDRFLDVQPVATYLGRHLKTRICQLRNR